MGCILRWSFASVQTFRNRRGWLVWIAAAGALPVQTFWDLALVSCCCLLTAISVACLSFFQASHFSPKAVCAWILIWTAISPISSSAWCLSVIVPAPSDCSRIWFLCVACSLSSRSVCDKHFNTLTGPSYSCSSLPHGWWICGWWHDVADPFRPNHRQFQSY